MEAVVPAYAAQVPSTCGKGATPSRRPFTVEVVPAMAAKSTEVVEMVMVCAAEVSWGGGLPGRHSSALGFWLGSTSAKVWWRAPLHTPMNWGGGGASCAAANVRQMAARRVVAADIFSCVQKTPPTGFFSAALY